MLLESGSMNGSEDTESDLRSVDEGAINILSMDEIRNMKKWQNTEIHRQDAGCFAVETNFFTDIDADHFETEPVYLNSDSEDEGPRRKQPSTPKTSDLKLIESEY